MTLDNMWSGIIGAFIGVLASFGIAILKEFFDNLSCINAIKSEIKALKVTFFSAFVNRISEDDEPLYVYYPFLDTDYFTIFNNNSCNIGKIWNSKEREQIILIYTMAKYFLDCLRTNNNCLDEIEKIENEYYDKNNKTLVEKHQNKLNFAKENLLHSKVNNILPVFIELKKILENYK